MLDWLTSVQGLLISSGVFILIMTTIIFIVTCRKEAKLENIEVKTEENKDDIKEDVKEDNINNIEKVNNSVDEDLVEVDSNIKETNIENVLNMESNNKAVEETNKAVEETVTIDLAEIENENDILELNSIIENAIVVEDVEDELVVSEPELVEEAVENIEEALEDDDEDFDIDAVTPDIISIDELELLEDDNNSVKDEMPVVEEARKVTIYGGYDPLEKTQSLPKVEERYAPYSAGTIKEEVEEEL